MNAAAPDPRRWKALILICTAIFVVVLDIAIVNVALPSIGRDLDFAERNLQWVITAYSLTYGGFLLLGGRAADLLGRRVIFMSGLALFGAASLVCGLSSSSAMLIVARGVQGLGAAIVTPAALSIISVTFTEGSERNKALGAWGAVGGSGAAAGVLMGGVLTKYFGWEWIFWVNVPVAAIVLVLTPFYVRESKRTDIVHDYDVTGAVSVTGGLILLVYAISQAPEVGLGDVQDDRPDRPCRRGAHLLPDLGATVRRTAADAARDLSNPPRCGREPERVPARGRPVRDVPAPDAVHAAGPEAFGAADRNT